MFASCAEHKKRLKLFFYGTADLSSIFVVLYCEAVETAL